jgi:hypothetical protein
MLENAGTVKWLIVRDGHSSGMDVAPLQHNCGRLNDVRDSSAVTKGFFDTRVFQFVSETDERF